MGTIARLPRALLAAGLLALGSVSANEGAGRLEFAIAAQPLSRAILELSRQSDTDIIASSQLIDGKRSREVRGTMTALDALNHLLGGSGLRAVRTSEGSLAIVRAGSGR